jgi:hypothetical protein
VQLGSVAHGSTGSRARTGFRNRPKRLPDNCWVPKIGRLRPDGHPVSPSGTVSVPQRSVAWAWEASMTAGYHQAPPMKKWIRERNRSQRWLAAGCGRSGNGSRPPGKNPRTIWDGGGGSFWRGAFEAIPFQQRLCRFGACAGTIRLRWLKAEGFIRKPRKDNDNDFFKSAPPGWHFSSREGA